MCNPKGVETHMLRTTALGKHRVLPGSLLRAYHTLEIEIFLQMLLPMMTGYLKATDVGI